MGVIDMNQLGHGGNVYTKPFIYDWAAVSANITPHPDAGLGRWTDEEIKTAITDRREPQRAQAVAVHAVRAVRESAGERPRRDRRVPALDSAARRGTRAARE